MLPSFNHFLLTRFNVKIDFQGKVDFEERINSEWLSYRFDLFNQFCYPSVTGQTNQYFKWIVLFDQNTPEFFKNKIKYYESYNNFIPVYIEYFNVELIKDNILQNMDGDPEYIITTRLDNDDGIHNKYIQMIHDNFRGQGREPINFPYGYVWNKNKIYFNAVPSNSFISLVEPTHGFKTVLCCMHNQLSELGSVLEIKSQPAWLQVVHDRNITNSLRGIRRSVKNLVGQFAINVNIENIIAQENIISLLTEQAINYVRVIRNKFRLQSTIRKIIGQARNI